MLTLTTLALLATAAASSWGAHAVAVPAASPPRRRDIVHGKYAEEEVPYFASLMPLQSGGICGSTLVAPQWVLTAAHCLTNVTDPAGSLIKKTSMIPLGDAGELFPSFFISFGNDNPIIMTAANIKSPDAQYEAAVKAQQNTGAPLYTRHVTEIRTHPDSDMALSVDLALLKLNEPVPVDPVRVNFVSHARTHEQVAQADAPGSPVISYGHGYVDRYNPASEKLREGRFKLVSGDECAEKWEVGNKKLAEKLKVPYNESDPMLHMFYDALRTQFVCADNSEKIDIRPGDSGGPLINTDDNVQIGVASFVYLGHHTGMVDHKDVAVPSAYVKVSKFQDWITSVAGPLDDSGRLLGTGGKSGDHTSSHSSSSSSGSESSSSSMDKNEGDDSNNAASVDGEEAGTPSQ